MYTPPPPHSFLLMISYMLIHDPLPPLLIIISYTCFLWTWQSRSYSYYHINRVIKYLRTNNTLKNMKKKVMFNQLKITWNGEKIIRYCKKNPKKSRLFKKKSGPVVFFGFFWLFLKKAGFFWIFLDFFWNNYFLAVSSDFELIEHNFFFHVF